RLRPRCHVAFVEVCRSRSGLAIGKEQVMGMLRRPPRAGRFRHRMARRKEIICVVNISLISCKIRLMANNGVLTLPRKERLILELLASEGPMYGLQLVEQSGGGLKRGTVYVTLGRMEAKGL